MAYPLVVTIVAFCFAAVLLRQYVQRQRPHALVWTAALSMGGLAGLAFVLFLADGRSVFFFKLYYVCGALLMAAYLGLGSLYLLAPRKVAHVTAVVLILLSAIGIVVVVTTHVDTAALQGANVEAGTKAIGGPAVAFVAVLNSFGALAVIGGACYSAWRLWKRQGPMRLLAANILIATGTILASLAGTLARVTGNGSAFWLLLAAGFIVLFGGFLLTLLSRVPSPSRDGAANTLPAA